MRKLAIIGAGGHAREVAEILRSTSGFRPLGFIEKGPELTGEMIDDLPVLGAVDWLADHRDVLVVVAIGNPNVVQRVVREVQDLGMEFAQAISPHSRISPLAEVGTGVTIFPGVSVGSRARIGAHATLNVGVTVSRDTVIGDYCLLNPGVRLGPNVTVGDGCYIGMGANVLEERRVGSWTTVGGGSTVVHDLPEHVTAVGAPARVIKRRADAF